MEKFKENIAIRCYTKEQILRAAKELKDRGYILRVPYLGKSKYTFFVKTNGGVTFAYDVTFISATHFKYIDCNDIFKSNKTIIIYRKDNETIALDKSSGKKGVAKCSPDDEFDFKTGAKLAFDRLLNEGKCKSPEFEPDKKYIFDKATFLKDEDSTPLDIRIVDCEGKEVKVLNEKYGKIGMYSIKAKWCIEKPSYYNGKVVCINSAGYSNLYTEGKIYEIKDGVFTFDDGDTNCGYTSFRDFTSGVSAKFIEIVESED